jgi:predicted DNA binding CopG/RHH family protein
MKFDEKRAKVEKQVIEYLTKRKFKEASLTVAAYEAEQTHPRGIGIDWKHYNPNHDIEMLKTIFESKPPKIIVRLGNEKLEAVRIAAAMMALWGESKAKKWLPTDFETGLPFDNDTAVRMIKFQAWHRATLERYSSAGIEHVEVYPAPDSCESCKKLAGKHYKLDEAPELPYEHCTHKMGCRCTFLAVV